MQPFDVNFGVAEEHDEEKAGPLSVMMSIMQC